MSSASVFGSFGSGVFPKDYLIAEIAGDKVGGLLSAGYSLYYFGCLSLLLLNCCSGAVVSGDVIGIVGRMTIYTSFYVFTSTVDIRGAICLELCL